MVVLEGPISSIKLRKLTHSKVRNKPRLSSSYSSGSFRCSNSKSCNSLNGLKAARQWSCNPTSAFPTSLSHSMLQFYRIQKSSFSLRHPSTIRSSRNSRCCSRLRMSQCSWSTCQILTSTTSSWAMPYNRPRHSSQGYIRQSSTTVLSSEVAMDKEFQARPSNLCLWVACSKQIMCHLW